MEKKDYELCSYNGKCMKVCDCDKCKVKFAEKKHESHVMLALTGICLGAICTMALVVGLFQLGGIA